MHNVTRVHNGGTPMRLAYPGTHRGSTTIQLYTCTGVVLVAFASSRCHNGNSASNSVDALCHCYQPVPALALVLLVTLALSVTVIRPWDSRHSLSGSSTSLRGIPDIPCQHYLLPYVSVPGCGTVCTTMRDIPVAPRRPSERRDPLGSTSALRPPSCPPSVGICTL